MRIGFLGNSNNYPFMLARAMRRAGHDVVFVLNQKLPLNRPENRYDDVDIKASDWILDYGDLEATELYQFLPESPRRDEMVGLLRGCDALVLNHGALSLAPLIGRPHLALLTGTDIQNLADPEYVLHAEAGGVMAEAWLDDAIGHQRAGIATAAAVSVFFRGLVPRYDATLDALGVGDDRRFFCWITDPLYVRATPPPPDRGAVRIFNLARLTWKGEDEGEFTMDHKASDVMIRGLGEFTRRHPEATLDIRLVEKGLQVREAKELVESCGLASQVTWLKEMSQREVFEEYRSADIVFDQMGLSIVAMGGLDAMATGRPLIANGRPDVMKHHAPETPICHASTVEEVLSQLERLVLSREERERVGRASRSYVEQNCSADGAAAICVERLDSVVSNPLRYSQWSQRLLKARERVVEARQTRLSGAERQLTAREGEYSLLAQRQRDVLARENYLAGREEKLAQREAQVAQREAEAAERGDQAARLEALASRSFKEYESLRIVRWQRALKVWKQRLGGRTGRD